MSRPKRILCVGDSKDFTGKLFISLIRKYQKGFIRLGHDVQVFDFRGAFRTARGVMGMRVARRLCKNYIVDKLLIEQAKRYKPDIVFIGFCNYLDGITTDRLKDAAPDAYFVGWDGDPWPSLQKNRIAVGSRLNLVFATNNGDWLREYSAKGPKSLFMPNLCDTDYERPYDVDGKWQSEILWTGKARESKKRYPIDDFRPIFVNRLANNPKCTLYGCLGRPWIGGVNYYYAISGAKISVSVNAANNVPMYHSDRLTHYMSCGSFVLSKRVPNSDPLYKDGVHLRYFEDYDDFVQLSEWYLKNEEERKRIAQAGMEWIHEHFNCTKIAAYTLEAIEKGTYEAPWIPG